MVTLQPRPTPCSRVYLFFLIHATEGFNQMIMFTVLGVLVVFLYPLIVRESVALSAIIDGIVGLNQIT
jgi:uncharacterized MnhB-related membrane protein